MACLVGAQLDAGHGNDHCALANLFSFFFLLFFRSLHLYYVINIHKIHNSLFLSVLPTYCCHCQLMSPEYSLSFFFFSFPYWFFLSLSLLFSSNTHSVTLSTRQTLLPLLLLLVCKTNSPSSFSALNLVNNNSHQRRRRNSWKKRNIRAIVGRKAEKFKFIQILRPKLQWKAKWKAKRRGDAAAAAKRMP